MVRVPVIAAGLIGLLTAAAVLAQTPAWRPESPAAAPFLTAPLQSAPATPRGAVPSPAAAAPAAAPPERITQTGKIAYYGPRFAGRKTASGERFDPEAMTMAHKTLPFGTRVRVTNLANGESVVVRVNDRGPSTSNRIADLSQGAAERIGMIEAGVVEARLEVLRVIKSP
jgi:rare lipoprotein A